MVETRDEIGPARFARQLDIQKEIEITSHAFGYCETAARGGFQGKYAPVQGPCNGLLRLAGTLDLIASNLFRLNDNRACECLTSQVSTASRCEGLREQLTTMRRYGTVIRARAELVLGYQVCASPEPVTNAAIRAACTTLAGAVAGEFSGGNAKPGQFNLAAPLPRNVSRAVTVIRNRTDGRYLSVVPENFVGVRQSICKLPTEPIAKNQCVSRILEESPDKAKDKPKAPPGPNSAMADLWNKKWSEVRWGMCNELALADANANTCRNADVYVDERGKVHLNSPLRTRRERRNATMCIDISDFDPSHPLMVTLGLDPTGSVPERLWPGETMRIGQIINKPVTPEDILHINVFGKPRGISLGEVLRVNGVVVGDPRANQDACRIAKSWVPVVDHEVPIGARTKQAVIPVTFGRGRDGETRKIMEDDYVVIWVRDIEPSGWVHVEYAQGQRIGYSPPPLLGTSTIPRTGDPSTGSAQGGDGRGDNPLSLRDLRSQTASVGQPVLPKRARYPGSRVLRLGTPAGNTKYNIKICTGRGPTPGVGAAAANDGDEAASPPGICSSPGARIVVNEKLFVQGDYYFGARLHFGYSMFPSRDLEFQRTPVAVSAGEDTFEAVRAGSNQGDYDLAILLAAYPLGRNPRSFTLNPLKKDYWKHSALLAGFTVRGLPWNDFYLGGSVPVANGVSLTVLSHFKRKDFPVDVTEGDLFVIPNANDGQTPDIVNVAKTRSGLTVGLSLGLSFDYDLFENAFNAVFSRFQSKKGEFLSSTAGDYE